MKTENNKFEKFEFVELNLWIEDDERWPLNERSKKCLYIKFEIFLESFNCSKTSGKKDTQQIFKVC